MTFLKCASLTSIVAALSIQAGSANAEDFARSKVHADQSLSSGTGATSLPTFRRQSGTLGEVTNALVAALCKTACATVLRQDLGERTRVRGAGWRLDVYGDGTMAEFTDERVSASAHALAVAPELKMSLTTLEKLGRRYIADQLASAIVLAPGETLVAKTAAFRTEGGVDRNGVFGPERITAQRIVFTREIDGRPVTGPGSKVTVTFLSDSSVESFRYDWSTYVPSGATQPMLGAKEILERVQRVTAQRTGSLSTAVLPAIASQAQPPSSPSDLGGNIRLLRLECGYYDPGMAGRGSSAVLQAGCYYHALHSTSGNEPMTAGLSGAVPAAVQPVPDDTWPEEAVLRGAAGPGLAAPAAAAAAK
jgi:hypothetical protein